MLSPNPDNVCFNKHACQTVKAVNLLSNISRYAYVFALIKGPQYVLTLVCKTCKQLIFYIFVFESIETC